MAPDNEDLRQKAIRNDTQQRTQQQAGAAENTRQDYSKLSRDQLKKLREDLERQKLESKEQYDLAAVDARAPTRSASLLAKQSIAENKVGSPADLFFDNSVIYHAYPPPVIPSDYPHREKFQVIYDHLSVYDLRLADLPTATRTEVRIPEFLVEEGKARVSWKTLDTTLGAMTPQDLDLLRLHQNDAAYEGLLRHQKGLPPLAVAPKKAAEEIIRHLPAIRIICERARVALALEQNEAESRRPWDAIFELVLPQPSSHSGVSPTEVYCGRERTLRFPLNALFEAVHSLDSEVKPEVKQTAAVSTWQTRLKKSLRTLEAAAGSWTAVKNTPLESVLSESMNAAQKAISDKSASVKRDLELWGLHNTKPFHELDCRAKHGFDTFRCDGIAFINIRDFWHGIYKKDALGVIGEFLLIRGRGQAQNTKPALKVPPLPQLIKLARSLAEMDTQAKDKGGETDNDDAEQAVDRVLVPPHLQLPAMIREDKRPQETLYQVLNQARYAIISTVRYLSQFGVYNTVVFAMATVGYEGHLLSGWGTKPSSPAEKPSGKPIKRAKEAAGKSKTKGDHDDPPIIDVEVHLADTNCPKFTIAREVEAIRFVAFLQQLRDVHVPNMRQAVQSRQEVFLKEWENSRIERGTFSRRFHWSAHHQKNPKGKLPETPMTRVRDQLNKVRKLDEKIGLVEAAAKSLTPGDANEVTE